MSLSWTVSGLRNDQIKVSMLTCAGVLPTPLVAVLLPAAQTPIVEPKSRVRVRKDLMMAMLYIEDV